MAAVLPNGEAQYYLTDQVDSVKVVTNDAGMVVTSHEYLPFGEDWITEGDTKNAPKYNSQELDKESGYYFYNARHYDPEIARFVTPDTVIDGELSTQGWNRFAYVHNNPIRYKDPTGHAGEEQSSQSTAESSNSASSGGNNQEVKAETKGSFDSILGKSKDSGLKVTKGSGGRTTIESANPNGKTIYFLYAGNTKNTQPWVVDNVTKMTPEQRIKEFDSKVKPAMENLAIDAAKKGYKVIFDDIVTKNDFKEALKQGNGIVFAGHGDKEGRVRLYEKGDQGLMSPSMINKNNVNPNLKFIASGSCHTDSKEAQWKERLPERTKFEGFKTTTTPSEINRFLNEKVKSLY